MARNPRNQHFGKVGMKSDTLLEVAASNPSARDRSRSRSPSPDREKTPARVRVTLYDQSAEFEVRYDLLPLELMSPRVLKTRGPQRHLEIVELRPMDAKPTDPVPIVSPTDKDKPPEKERRKPRTIRRYYDEKTQEEVFRAKEFVNGVTYQIITRDTRTELAKVLTEDEKSEIKSSFTTFDQNKDGLLSWEEVEAYFAERLDGNKASLRQKLVGDALETKMRLAEIDGAASMMMLKKQDLDHDHKISWDEYLNYRVWLMRLQGRLTSRLPEKKKFWNNDGTASLAVPHHMRKRSSGIDSMTAGIASVKSNNGAPPSIPIVPPLGFATPPDTERRHRSSKHRHHRHHHHAADHAVDAEPTPRVVGGLIPSLGISTGSNASAAGIASIMATPPSPEKEKRKSSHRSRRHHSAKDKDISSVTGTAASTIGSPSTVASGLGSIVDSEHKEKDKHRKKSKSKERRHRSKERRHRSKERGDSKQQSTNTVLPPVL